MRRIETYVGQQVYEWAFSSQAQLTMTAIAKVCGALFGTSGTVNGLACTPTSPAGMTVQIGAGEIYQVEPLEATTCGTLPANTTNTILKQGIQLGTYTTATFAAPGTSGQSINYLIEAQYQDQDISLDPTTGNSPVVLQFYNALNPATPWSGPNNSGSTSNTFRDGIIAYTIKPGVAATTGSQVTPSPDTGWIGLWVVTVPFGATTLTSASIAQYTGSPILPNGVLQSILTSNLTYGVDGGSANTVQAKFPVPVTTLVDGMDVWVKIAAANNGATTFTPNPGVITPSPVIGAAHAALQGNELVAGGRANFIWRQDVTSWVLTECTGAAIQVAPATQTEHALQLGQAQAMRQQWQSAVAYGASQALPFAQVTGGQIVYNGASAGTFTLPAQSSAQANTPVDIFNQGSTTASTLTITAAGTDTILTPAGAAVASFTVQPGASVRLFATGTAGLWCAWQGNGVTRGAGLMSTQQFATAGTFTYTPTAGTRWIRVRLKGSGAGSGAAPATSAGQVSGGGPGGEGGYCESIIFSGFAGQSVVIGAPGPGGAAGANPGGNAANSTFMGMTAQGGKGGGTYGPTTGGFVSISSGAASASGGNILNIAGGVGAVSWAAVFTGAGAFGVGGMGGGETAVASPAVVAGAGGGGLASAASTAAVAGLAGLVGYCVIEEYA